MFSQPTCKAPAQGPNNKPTARTLLKKLTTAPRRLVVAKERKLQFQFYFGAVVKEITASELSVLSNHFV